MSLLTNDLLSESSNFSSINITSINMSEEDLQVYNHYNESLLDLQQRFHWSEDMWFRHSPEVSIVLCMAYTIVFVLGIVGNCFVVAVVVRTPRMRTVTNFFIVNLAFADILVLLFCLPSTLISNILIRESNIILLMIIFSNIFN